MSNYVPDQVMRQRIKSEFSFTEEDSMNDYKANQERIRRSIAVQRFLRDHGRYVERWGARYGPIFDLGTVYAALRADREKNPGRYRVPAVDMQPL